MKKWLMFFLVVGSAWACSSLAGAEGRTIVKFRNDVVVREGMRVRDAVAIGGHVIVNGVVEHDAVAIGGSVFMGSRAVVGRNAVSVGGTVEKAEGAEIRGEQIEVNLPGLASVLTSVPKGSRYVLRRAFRVISFIAFIGFLALALLIVAILPKPVSSISAAVEDSPLKVTLCGLLGVMLIVPLAIFLVLSVVGIVLIPLEIFLVVCALLVGYIAVAQLIGKKITAALRRPNQPMLLETFCGLALLWVIGWVPVLGCLVKAVAGLLGLGGVIASLLSIGKA